MELTQIGDRLKALRLNAALTQDDLAAIIGKDRSVYARMEKGQSAPTLETLCLLKEKLNVSIDWLLSGSGSMIAEVEPFDVLMGPVGEIPANAIEMIREGVEPNRDVIRAMASDMLRNPKFYGKTLLEYVLIWKK